MNSAKKKGNDMKRIPIPKDISLDDHTRLKSFSGWYKKQLEKFPEYGKKREAREQKRRDFFENK